MIEQQYTNLFLVKGYLKQSDNLLHWVDRFRADNLLFFVFCACIHRRRQGGKKYLPYILLSPYSCDVVFTLVLQICGSYSLFYRCTSAKTFLA